MDPFAVLGLPAEIEVDPQRLEARYLTLARECHPDRHRGADAYQQLAMLARAADLNGAYRSLKDPWQRAEALLELRSPGVLDATKKLAPAFLGEALELAEEVAAADADAAKVLRPRLEQAVRDDFAAVRAAILEADFPAAATRLHQSRYHRKALTDLAR
jgi:molecular chaperone HscB